MIFGFGVNDGFLSNVTTNEPTLPEQAGEAAARARARVSEPAKALDQKNGDGSRH
jgi:hypothetical protein